MKKVSNKLMVAHHPQIPCKAFTVEVKDEIEAKKMIDTLANQHLFLFDQNIIPDYSNIMEVLMWDEDLEEDEDGLKWCTYFNEAECMDWDEFETTYLEKV